MTKFNERQKKIWKSLNLNYLSMLSLLKNCLTEWKVVKMLFHSHTIFYFTCMNKLIDTSKIIIFNEELSILFS